MVSDFDQLPDDAAGGLIRQYDPTNDSHGSGAVLGYHSSPAEFCSDGAVKMRWTLRLVPCCRQVAHVGSIYSIEYDKKESRCRNFVVQN
jgi:hypothetical protein